MELHDLNDAVVRAKAASYVGGGRKTASSRPGSHDLEWSDGPWLYRDSYFGGTDFIGQEVMWLREAPVWSMSYYGHILKPELIDAQRAGETIKAALSMMYREGRFYGGFEWTAPHGRYVDVSLGDVSRFHGREVILVEGAEAYTLDYFGGLVKP